MNNKITYRWTSNYDASIPGSNFCDESDYIVTDGIFDFEDYLRMHEVEYEREGDYYWVIDPIEEERTGEVYWVTSEEPTDEELKG